MLILLLVAMPFQSDCSLASQQTETIITNPLPNTGAGTLGRVSANKVLGVSWGGIFIAIIIERLVNHSIFSNDIALLYACPLFADLCPVPPCSSWISHMRCCAQPSDSLTRKFVVRIDHIDRPLQTDRYPVSRPVFTH